MARFSDDAPYKQSRAALRQIYGPRAITSGGQSARDTTPSGRARFLEERGASAPAAERMVRQEFRDRFPEGIPAERPTPITMNPFRRAPLAGGFASPEDVGLLRSQGASGTLRTPYGTVSLGLVPQTAPAEDIAPFIPTPAAPLSNFSLPSRTPFTSSLLTPKSPWRKSIYG